MEKKRPPLAVRAQRVLLWFLAVMMLGNALWSVAEVGGGAFGVGYALPYFFLTACFALFAARIGHGEKWVWVSLLVLYGLLILLQVGRVLGGDPSGLIGLLFLLLGLVLSLRSTSRKHFSRSCRSSPYKV
ncbi:hypothetical protein [Nocardiopsis sp. CNT312]|uniref:hypothetical protein n=1 Tax=Nocardiopsis sp. CNT312 TaxID=1137268 RepID=UPI0004B5E608|nr:hypothetical protein [Nocardiopsis sp. CNT312]